MLPLVLRRFVRNVRLSADMVWWFPRIRVRYWRILNRSYKSCSIPTNIGKFLCHTLWMNSRTSLPFAEKPGNFSRVYDFYSSPIRLCLKEFVRFPKARCLDRPIPGPSSSGNPSLPKELCLGRCLPVAGFLGEACLPVAGCPGEPSQACSLGPPRPGSSGLPGLPTQSKAEQNKARPC